MPASPTDASRKWCGRNCSAAGSVWSRMQCTSTPRLSYTYTYFFCAAANMVSLCRKVTSRTTSLTCTSHTSALRCQSTMARWPLRPPSTTCRPLRWKSRQYGPSCGRRRSMTFWAAPVSTAAAMSACLAFQVRSTPSASRYPASSGSSHSLALTALACASLYTRSACLSLPLSFLSITFLTATPGPRSSRAAFSFLSASLPPFLRFWERACFFATASGAAASSAILL
mmetsp:Transcript_2371/g.5959  ORF Transcript_2371/g.5959 Transcript_2371/m.5959 type:complete len:227 (-) Transcript_2371:165-845(-)